MAGHLVARLLHFLKQVRVPLKGTGGNIDSPERGGKRLSVEDYKKTVIFLQITSDLGVLSSKSKAGSVIIIIISCRYLWISGLFLGFIISTSAAFLWYMANRSLKLMSEDLKC